MLVLNFQRMSTEDGPGLRTTLFVKGCPLKCEWCHNPESISVKRENEWIAVRCIGCRKCVETCKIKALSANENGIFIDRSKCLACGACVEACPTGALETKGVQMSVEQVFAELIKDKAYFGSDGGVTLSGGEIMLQADEAGLLLKMLKAEDISTAIDTSGMCKREDFDKVLPYTNVFLFDIKHIDDEEHKKLTGVSNKQILSNFDYLNEKIKGTNKQMWVRTPIIPGSTDTDENVSGIAKFLSKRSFERWEMCAFNNLCRDKYERLYKEWKYQKTPLMMRKRMEELVAIAKQEGLSEVYFTGATHLNEEV